MRKMMVFAGIALSASFAVLASELPSIPEKPDMKRYESVLAPWHDYLLQVRAADRIIDPLERCLAFPDLPGNKWPKGHAQAHCLIHHDTEIPTVAGIGASLDRGELPPLEASMRSLLDRHFSTTDYSEAIHELFNYRFDAGEVSDRVSAKWLALSPDSAFAHLARASHLARAAIKTRGTGFAATVPRENFRRMSELADQAMAQYREAIRINPRLIAAHTGMLQVAMFDSRDEVESEAFEAANKLDPACAELANVHMRSMSPRWGGDYEQMLAYANALAANVARRPQLAIYLARPYGDRGSVLLDAEQYDQETVDVLEIAARTGSDEASLLSASYAARLIEKDENKAASYFLQVSRFKDLGADAAGLLAWELATIEPAMSVRYALMALRQDPDNAAAHYNAGHGYFDLRMYDEADAHYRITIESPENRQASLREVAEMWLLGSVDPKSETSRKAGAARAKPYLERLTKEYPDDGRGLIMTAMYHGIIDPRIDDADIVELRSVVKKADRADPWQAQRVELLEAMLKQIDALKAKPSR